MARLGRVYPLMHQRVILRGRAFYRLTRAGLLPVGGGFRAFVSHAMYVERARRVLASDIDAEIGMRDRAADLARDMDRRIADRSALRPSAPRWTPRRPRS